MALPRSLSSRSRPKPIRGGPLCVQREEEFISIVFKIDRGRKWCDYFSFRNYKRLFRSTSRKVVPLPGIPILLLGLSSNPPFSYVPDSVLGRIANYQNALESFRAYGTLLITLEEKPTEQPNADQFSMILLGHFAPSVQSGKQYREG